MSRRIVTLEDKYAQQDGRVFLSGIQALVRLPLDQARRDRAAGHNTAGFISGYRGSPLGGYDQQLRRAQKYLDENNIRLWEGLNEDLGATAVWGSQQVGVFPENATVEGVFGLWYGKAPGVDRTGDVFKHANFAGVSAFGGVLAVAGDDHACKSSTLPSQSEFAFIDAEIPVLNPSSVQEVLDFGLYGWAMSRFSGAWVGFIALADTMDSGAVIDVGPDRMKIITPEFHKPEGGLSIRGTDKPMDKELRLRRYKLPAAQAFVRANQMDRVVLESARPRLGLVATGQGVRDVFEALGALGLSPEAAASAGVTVYKVAMPWPLEPTRISAFAASCETVLVIEHKRPLIEPQLKTALYAATYRPVIIGKNDAQGAPLLSDLSALSIPEIARAIYDHLPVEARTEQAVAYFERVGRSLQNARELEADVHRKPHYCSGCPHNTSTVVPEGSRALAGIGCHYMATFMNRADFTSQMGGEGIAWVGQQPFTKERHVFVNLGDGTYSHSGSLAIRAAVTANINITYKLLYNGAVAMTGGQDVEAGQSVPEIVRQLRGEKVAKIAVVADDITRYAQIDLGEGVGIFDRSRLDEVQRALREIEGVTILIYDQVCATEYRRKQKRGLVKTRTKRAFINSEICEGCGDCSVKSNCLSVEPLETELGTKREINQNSCNLDTRCVDGFCPSFVTVEGAIDAHRTREKPQIDASDLPEPVLPALTDGPFNVLFTGVGGTGVTTLAAVLGMAAHIDGLAATTLDMAGLAQKGGPVLSHVRFAKRPEDIRSGRTPTAMADALIAGDLIVAASAEALPLVDRQTTKAVANTDVAPTSEFIFDRNVRFVPPRLYRKVEQAVSSLQGCNAEALAASYFYDNVFANTILMGFAWQRGLLPVSEAALRDAITLNGAAVKQNLAAFDLGRVAAAAPDRLKSYEPPRQPPAEKSIDDLITDRANRLTAYQDTPYATQYRELVEHVRAKEMAAGLGDSLTRAVATYAFKLMAYKDEYEVARLYTNGDWEKSLRQVFAGKLKVRLHLSPPLIAPKDPATGHAKKIEFGAWMLFAFKLLAPLKGLRKTPIDPFGQTAERKMERRLRDTYLQNVRRMADELSPATHDLAIKIASTPDQIRGYGHVKDAAVAKVAQEEAGLWSAYDAARTSKARPSVAAE
jgi:indolepyruvate ferredoxin oxidoreductase